MQTWKVLVGDVRAKLAELPDASVQTCVTSPPYWGLRDYGVAGQIGLEDSADAYVAAMVEVFQSVWRVLKDDGTVWLNLGDSYQNAKGQAGGVDPKQPARRHGLRPQDVTIPGLKPKDLVGIPWMVAFALRADGWFLRNDIIWHKPNPMPESVVDRCTKAHEYVFLLSKSRAYYFDAAAIAEPLPESSVKRYQHAVDTNEQFDPTRHKSIAGVQTPMQILTKAAAGVLERGTRNKRTVWTVPTQAYAGAHFATYPEPLVEPCVLAGSRVGDTVLDPFTGSGTTGAVALRLGRSFVGCELNPEYAELARTRIGAALPLFASEVSVDEAPADHASARSADLFP
jgi:DNA modification methylase